MALPWSGCIPTATALLLQLAFFSRCAQGFSRAYAQVKRAAARATRVGDGVFGLTMETIGGSAQGMLLDVPEVAQVLGFSVHQTRRFLADPPAGFPAPLRVGARIFVKRPLLAAWVARDDFASGPAAPSSMRLESEHARRPRGRPKKSEVL